MIRLTVLGLALALVGCGLMAPEVRIEGARPMDPPPIYAQWYRDTERCLGLTGDFGAVRWFVAERIVWDGQDARAATTFPDDITVVHWFVEQRLTIRHEAAHHITQLGESIHLGGGMHAICDGATP